MNQSPSPFPSALFRAAMLVLMAAAATAQAQPAAAPEAAAKPASTTSASGLTFTAVTRDLVEARVKESPGSNGKRHAALVEMFAQAGCPGTNLSEQPVKYSANPNVICTLPGASGSVIVVGAHFDKVARSSGVVDNWSGASLLPSLYQSLRGARREHTFVFIGFTDEEQGMVGSQSYVQQLTPEQLGKIRAMINMDTLGLSTTEVWYSHSDHELVADLYRVAEAMKVPATPVNVDEVGSSDSESFAKAKVPRITIHSVTQETFHILHTPDDNLKALNLDNYYQTYRLMAAYLTYLDGALKERAAPAAAK